MSSVTFQIGLLNGTLTSPYNGTLALDLSGIAPSGGTLTLGTLAPVTLTASSIGNNLFNLTGSNSDVNVASTYMAVTSFPNPNGDSPIGEAGYISLTVQSGTAQTLYIFGYGPPQASTGNQMTERSGAAGTASTDTFNYKFTVVENNRSNQWFTLGNGTLNATGSWVPLGPVSKYYAVRGTLSFDDGSSLQINSPGGASVTYWYANGSVGITGYQLITISQPPSITVSEGITHGAVGAMVACGNFMVFWVGTAA